MISFDAIEKIMTINNFSNTKTNRDRIKNVF